MEQAKIFRKKMNHNISFKISEYGRNQNYSDLIQSEKSQGYRQVIINSLIMITLIDNICMRKNVVLRKITFNQNVDEEYQEEIDYLVDQLKGTDKIKNLKKLVSELQWASEKNSIDIESISVSTMYDEKWVNLDLLCNGILSGENLNAFFYSYIKKIIEDVFNEY